MVQRPAVWIEVHEDQVSVVGQWEVKASDTQFAVHIFHHVVGNFLRQVDAELANKALQVLLLLVHLNEEATAFNFLVDRVQRSVGIKVHMVRTSHELQVEVTKACDRRESVFGGRRAHKHVHEDVATTASQA